MLGNYAENFSLCKYTKYCYVSERECNFLKDKERWDDDIIINR